MKKKKSKKPKKRLTQSAEEADLSVAIVFLHNAWVIMEHLDEFASERKVIYDIKNKLDNKILKLSGFSLYA